MSQYLSQLAGKRIVVTGGVGSVGRAIVEKLAASPVGHVRVIDNNESGLFDMEMDFAGRKGKAGLDFFHADITDEREMRRTFDGMDLCSLCRAETRAVLRTQPVFGREGQHRGCRGRRPRRADAGT